MTKQSLTWSALTICMIAIAGCGGGGGGVSPTPPSSATTTTGATATPKAKSTATPTTSPTNTPTAAPTTLTTQTVYTLNGTANGSGVTTYTPILSGIENQAPTGTITLAGDSTGLNFYSGVAIDSSGKIYVATAADYVYVFAAHPIGAQNLTPIATITGANTMMDEPAGIALDSNGKIYVVNSAALNYSSVTVYAANPTGTIDEVPLATIQGSHAFISQPSGIALDSSGKIYVTNTVDGSVSVFAANPSGTLNEAPVATIGGSNTGLGYVYGIAIDASGKVYVANGGSTQGQNISVFAANPSGTVNVAPVAEIVGSNTGLNFASSIALDSSGRIYVTNQGNTFQVYVYAANPSGTMNEAPLGTITGSNTELDYPLGIAVH